MTPPPPAPGDRGFWFTLWTVTKLTVVLAITAVIAVFMLTSTDSTVTPAAPIPPTPTVLKIVIGQPTATSVPTTSKPLDAVIPGHLYVVKGSTIYKLHLADPPIPVAVGRQPAVSPDGSHLAYILFEHNYQDLYTLNLKTGAGAKLVDDSLTDPTDQTTGKTAAEPAWSSDGSSIFFSWSYPGAPFPSNPSSYDRTDFSITRCPATGPCAVGASTQITNPDFESGGDYGSAPRPLDPNILVYSKYIYQENTDQTYWSIPRLVAHDLQTGNEVFLSPPLTYCSEPAWNPTGRYLAFAKTTFDQRQTSIWVMPFHPVGDPNDYHHAHLLVTGAPFAAYPTFSPDGRFLAYLASGADGHLHLFIGRVHIGHTFAVDHIQEVQRIGIVDGGERLAWAP